MRVGLVLLTLWASWGVEKALPNEAAKFGPFVEAGAVGEAVNARVYSITVLGIRGAPKIVVDELQGTYSDTDGIFVLVKGRVVAHLESTHAFPITLRDGASVSYAPTQRVHQPMSVNVFEPGVPVEGEWMFEVPKAAVTSLTFRFGEPDVDFDDRARSIGEVPLDIDEAQLAGWLAIEDPVTVAEPEVVA